MVKFHFPIFSEVFPWFLMVSPRSAFLPWCLTVMAPSRASWRWSAVEAAENFCRHRSGSPGDESWNFIGIKWEHMGTPQKKRYPAGCCWIMEFHGIN